MKSSVFIRTAVYLRLSVEDNNNRGNSLENQQLIIQDYLADKPEFKVVGTYTDNGLSGLNYNRPGFQQMLEEIEAGHIDCVIVKDLSRLTAFILQDSKKVKEGSELKYKKIAFFYQFPELVKMRAEVLAGLYDVSKTIEQQSGN